MTSYRQHRHLVYSAPQLFGLVADVEQFPLFMRKHPAKAAGVLTD